VLLSKFFPKVFGRFQNPHVLLIRCGFEITQALTLTKIPGFAKPSINHFPFKHPEIEWFNRGIFQCILFTRIKPLPDTIYVINDFQEFFLIAFHDKP